MSQELLIGTSLLLIPAIIFAVIEWQVERKRRQARELAQRSKTRERRTGDVG
ncbi:hypothetical protein [Croceicoccus marinus]|jgi:hypothetical protein|uniref:Heme exporter protein D n=1 Tax=Croceicoccus marinus TaxID=450378 RepID=A0A7G6VUY7_9SPHN|nr:hypothetical protein [Croceicoccus marinus]QNE05552.1 hypothetical protein H4O24_02300 [Croceicoccus marinus]